MRRLFFLFFFPLCADAQFVRVAIGFEQSRDTTVRDVRCSSTQPPALFGCGFFAKGDMGSAIVPELAVGIEPSMRTRFEVALAHRSLQLDANANFTGVGGDQPVTADVRSLSMLITGAVDLAPASWRIRPFVMAGAGLSHNSIDEVVYAFPGIGPQAFTITSGGTYTDIAMTAGAGLSVPITSNFTLDAAWRLTDFGDVRTDAGPATIVRPTRELTIGIDATRADLQTSGVSVSLRWRGGRATR